MQLLVGVVDDGELRARRDRVGQVPEGVVEQGDLHHLTILRVVRVRIVVGSKDIGEELLISSHTARDHVKAIYEKAQVNSRGELVATLLSNHVLGRLHDTVTHVAAMRPRRRRHDGCRCCRPPWPPASPICCGGSGTPRPGVAGAPWLPRGVPGRIASHGTRQRTRARRGGDAARAAAGAMTARTLLVRREAPGETAASTGVHARAFPIPDGARTPVEVALLDRLRESDAWLPHLSLVAATSTGEIVGHLVCSRAHVADHPVLGLGPVAVVPDRQGQGVGSALLHAILAAAEACDEPLVGVLGDPGYYGRFGFVAATRLGIEAPDPGWAEYFQVRTLCAHPADLEGRFRYAPPFDDR